MLVVGASVNHWTTKHGAMINQDATVIQVDLDPRAIARNRPVTMGVIGDAQACATALTEVATAHTGFRTEALAEQIAQNRWPDTPYEDTSTDTHIDPRTLTIALNDKLPPDKQVAVDSGHFLGWPAMYLDVPDAHAWVFPNGFQSVGLGLGNAIGAAIANPRTERPSPRSATAVPSWRWPSSRRRLASDSTTCSC